GRCSPVWITCSLGVKMTGIARNCLEWRDGAMFESVHQRALLRYWLIDRSTSPNRSWRTRRSSAALGHEPASANGRQAETNLMTSPVNRIEEPVALAIRRPRRRFVGAWTLRDVRLPTLGRMTRLDRR